MSGLTYSEYTHWNSIILTCDTISRIIGWFRTTSKALFKIIFDFTSLSHIILFKSISIALYKVISIILNGSQANIL